MTRPARILILTNGPLARNPRVVKEASALGAAGHAVTVLGVRNHRASLPLDADLSADALFRHEQIEMLRGPAAVLRRLHVRLARDLRTRGLASSIHSLGPASALLRRARRHPADLVIAHNEISHWAALRLLDAGRLVAADFEDWHSEDLPPADRAGRPLALLRAVEGGLLRRAAYVSTTSDALAAALHARYGGRLPEVVTNSFPLGPVATPRAATEPPAFFWFSQTTGPGRGLEVFVESWSRTTTPSRLVLLGEVKGGYDQRLLDLMPAERRRLVSFLPLVPPARLPRLVAQHDVGLALEDGSIPNRDLTITNKILQYLNAGLAVVATPTAGQREVLARSPDAGLLLDFSDPLASASELDRLLRDPDRLRARSLAARALAEDRYCWEREAPRLLETVARALATRPAPSPAA